MGMPGAAASPKPARRSWSRLPCGSGTAIDTPIVTVPTCVLLSCVVGLDGCAAALLPGARGPGRSRGQRAPPYAPEASAALRLYGGTAQCLAGRKPTLSYVWASVSAATVRAFWAPLAKIESSVSGSSRYSWVRSLKGVTN